MAAGGAAPLIAAESNPGPVAPFIRAVAPEVVAEPARPPPRQGTRLEKVAGAYL